MEKHRWPLFLLCFKTIALGSSWGNKVNFDSICLLLYMMLQKYYTLTMAIFKKVFRIFNTEKTEWQIDRNYTAHIPTIKHHRQGPLEAPTKSLIFSDKIFNLLRCRSSGLWLTNITIGVARISTLLFFTSFWFLLMQLFHNDTMPFYHTASIPNQTE